MLKALEYISEHYADGGINITEIAQHLGVSEGHLSHVFKKETNYTVVGYLTRYRIHMALKLLRDCRIRYTRSRTWSATRTCLFRQHLQEADRTEPIGISDRCR